MKGNNLMNSITAIILTMNEEKNIGPCIESIKDVVSKIIVVDSGSSDNTVKIAEREGAYVIKHKFIHYADQFNWALDNLDIDTKWILRIDADERLTEELSKEINKELLNNENEITGYIFKLRIYFMNRWIKHGGVYPFKKLMLFKYKIGRLENRRKDAHSVVAYGKVKELRNDALHYDFKDLKTWVNKHNWYVDREVLDYFDVKLPEESDLSDKKITKTRKFKNNFYYKLPILIRSKLYYFYRYYFKLGFLDGKEGKIFHFLQAYWYRFLVDARIYEMKATKNSINDLEELK